MNETAKQIAHSIFQANFANKIGRRPSKELSAEQRGIHTAAFHVACSLKPHELSRDEQDQFVGKFMQACGF